MVNTSQYDLQEVEVRVSASTTDQPDPVDPYIRYASRLFEVDLSEVTPEQRSTAKSIARMSTYF